MSQRLPSASRSSGTQSLGRAAAILRELATRPRVGWGLTELAARCGLEKATTHRILGGLVRERLVARHPDSQRYLPGPLLFELGLAISAPASLQAAAQESVHRIAGRYGGISALTLASGYDAVCCAHAGQVATRALSFAVGDRRPMVMNSAGVAMLVCLPAAEMRAAISYGMPRAAHLGTDRVRLIRDMIEQSSRLHYGLNQNNTVAGITGVAIALLDAARRPMAAISVSGTDRQFPNSSIATLVKALRIEVETLGKVCAQVGTQDTKALLA
ncbi:MAG: helix-turn-helix domain-containing protein [Pseudomonadota bacterium]